MSRLQEVGTKYMEVTFINGTPYNHLSKTDASCPNGVTDEILSGPVVMGFPKFIKILKFAQMLAKIISDFSALET